MKNHNKVTKTESAKKQPVKTQIGNTGSQSIPREIVDRRNKGPF
jgi:hypothetical protein